MSSNKFLMRIIYLLLIVIVFLITFIIGFIELPLVTLLLPINWLINSILVYKIVKTF